MAAPTGGEPADAEPAVGEPGGGGLWEPAADPAVADWDSAGRGTPVHDVDPTGGA